VPVRLCHEQGYLTCGAIMAWFDEISTFALVVADATHRPGVRYVTKPDVPQTPPKTDDDSYVSSLVPSVPTVSA
jgi:hypothetical protein